MPPQGGPGRPPEGQKCHPPGLKTGPNDAPREPNIMSQKSTEKAHRKTKQTMFCVFGWAVKINFGSGSTLRFASEALRL